MDNSNDDNEEEEVGIVVSVDGVVVSFVVVESIEESNKRFAQLLNVDDCDVGSWELTDPIGLATPATILKMYKRSM